MSEVGAELPNQEPQTTVAEVKAFSAEHNLTKEETGEEAARLIDSFVSTLKEDPDVKNEIAQSFFDYDPNSGRNRGYGSVFVDKGNASYIINTREAMREPDEYGDHFYIVREEGDDKEELRIAKLSSIAMPDDKARIEYSHSNNEDSIRVKNNGVAVDGARTLLAKTQRDFAKAK